MSALAKQLSWPVISAGQMPVSAGAVWSEPLTLMVFVVLLVPQAFVIVYVRVIVQLQSSVKVFASAWVTVTEPLQPP